MSDFSAFDNALRSLESIPLARVAGRLVRLNGILLESVGCPLMTGQLCRIESANHTLIDAQAVGFRVEALGGRTLTAQHLRAYVGG